MAPTDMPMNEMYRIDPASNRLSRLRATNFTELQYSERHHLQEWIANQPDAFGEDLLIIQKEFDGFNDTRERLDLLAIDKSGQLVVIENKLDDSGRDVVWQALKYASYCSTFSKTQIVEIFQRYLDRTAPGQDARSHLCEFLGRDEFDTLVLNQGSDQRLILVAAQFRKEVTSTVLWLLKHQVHIKCFRATPFVDGGAQYLTLEQVIPLPEAEELMIGMAEKESEEQQIAERGQADRQRFATSFWNAVLPTMKNARITPYANVSAGKDSWLNAGTGLGGIVYTTAFTKTCVRILFSLQTKSKDLNKACYDFLQLKRTAIEAVFGERLDWRRMDQNISSQIVCEVAFDVADREAWPKIANWLALHMQSLVAAFSKEVPELRSIVEAPAARWEEDSDDGAS